MVAKEPPSKEKNAPAPKMALIHQDVEIPDLWNGEFTTSTVIGGEEPSSRSPRP